MLTATVRFTLFVMDVLEGDTVNHEALAEAVSVAARELVLETVIVWLGGLVAPCTA